MRKGGRSASRFSSSRRACGLARGLRAALPGVPVRLPQAEEHERQLRSHLQQLDKLKAQYAERSGRLEAATKARACGTRMRCTTCAARSGN